MKKITIFILLSLVLISISSCSCSTLVTEIRNIEEHKTTINNHIDQNITDETIVIDKIDILQIEQAIKKAYEKVCNSVFVVRLSFETLIEGYTALQPEKMGSAIIYKREEVRENDELVNYKYYFLTNHHVITGDKPEFTYHATGYFGKDQPDLDLEIMGSDNKMDIACGVFYSPRYLNPVEIQEYFEIGDLVFTVGTPMDISLFNSMTFGTISSDKRYLLTDTDEDLVLDFPRPYVQSDAVINSGNSGGGLFNLKGELLAIPTMKRINDNSEGLGFSVCAYEAVNICNNYLEKGEKVPYLRLGISTYDIRNITDNTMIVNNLQEIPDYLYTDIRYGLYVKSIDEASPLKNSGIEVDDIILSYDGINIYNLQDLSGPLTSLSKYQYGDTMTLTYYSRTNDEIKEAIITLTLTM